MAKVKLKYDIGKVEVGGGEDVPDGTYRAKIQACDAVTPEGKDERLEVWLELLPIRSGPLKGKKFRRIPTYINTESEAAAFRVRELLEAVGLMKPKSKKGIPSFDTADIKGKTVVIRTQAEEYPPGTGQMRARVASILPLPDDEGADEPEDDEPDEQPRARRRRAAEAPEPEEPASAEDGGEDDEFDFPLPEDPDELSEWDDDDLIGAAEEREVEVKYTGRGRNKKLDRDSLVEALAELAEEGEGEEGGEEPEGDDYDEWDLSELKDELKERGLRTAGKKEALVKRLREDDASDEEPF